jgi:hypothetical protein
MPPFPGDGGVGVIFVVEGENVDMSEVVVALVEEEEEVGMRDPEMKKWADSAIWLLPKLIVALAS